MKTILTIGLILTFTTITAEEFWTPSEHTAYREQKQTAYTEPVYSMDLFSEVNGKVMEVIVKEGDVIKNNSTIIKIDPAFINLSVQKSKIAYQNALTQVLFVEKNIALLELQKTYDELEWKRVEELAKNDQVSDSERDRKKHAFDIAIVNLESAIVNKKVMKEQAALAKNTLETINEEAKKYNITAPVGWIVTERFVQPKSIASVSSPLLSLSDCRTLIVKTKLSEKEIKILKTKKQIVLHFDKKEVPSKIRNIDVRFDKITRKRTVTLEIDSEELNNPIGGLRCSLSVKIPQNNSYLIPLSYIHKKYDESIVYNKNGKEIVIDILQTQNDMAIIDKTSIDKSVVLKKEK